VREQQVRTCQTITGIDRLIGRLRQRLVELGIAEKTILIFTSDHGLMHGEWGYGGKCLLYEPSIHVPLIIHDPRPDARRGIVRRELAVSPDVAPTILDLCGVRPPAAMQGRSLFPLTRGADPAWRKDFFAECLMLGQNYPLVMGVRGERWKYMRYWPYQPAPDDYREVLNLGLKGESPAYEELFDLQSDPTERTNLATRAEHGAQLAAMRRRCVELQREALGRAPEAPLQSGTVQDWKTDMAEYYSTVKRASRSR
jgi:arylsulfatase A-like enzyme